METADGYRVLLILTSVQEPSSRHLWGMHHLLAPGLSWQGSGQLNFCFFPQATMPKTPVSTAWETCLGSSSRRLCLPTLSRHRRTHWWWHASRGSTDSKPYGRQKSPQSHTGNFPGKPASAVNPTTEGHVHQAPFQLLDAN